MGNCEKLKEEYLDSLSKMIQEHKAIASDLRKNGADDEAILESIKGNVVNIFSLWEVSIAGDEWWKNKNI